MKTLILLALLCPVICFAQEDDTTNRSAVFNLYRKDAAVINAYSYEFAKNSTSMRIDTNSKGVFIKNCVLVRIPRARCYDSILIRGDVALMAKDNRARVEFNNVNFEIFGFTGSCPATGPLKDFYNCKECGLRGLLVRDKVTMKFQSILKYYRDFAADKAANDKNNW